MTKIYVFERGSYLVGVRQEIQNGTAAAIQAHAYYQLVRDGNPPEGDSKMLPTYTGVALYNQKDKFQKVGLRGNRQRQDAIFEDRGRRLDRHRAALFRRRLDRAGESTARVLHASAG